MALGNCLKKIPKRQVVLEQSPSFYSPSAHQSLGTYKQSSTKIVRSSPSHKSSGSSHTSTPASSYKPSHKTYSPKQSSCAKPVFSSTSVKNTTTTTIQDTEICANVTVMEIVEGPGSTFCENTTFTPKTFSRTFLMDVVEKLCIDYTTTICNTLVDTEVVFMEKNICNKACTKDCTASSVANCEEGSREVEEETLSEDCKEELKEECTTGQEVCTTEITEECTSTSSHPNSNYPMCKKVPVKVCKATTECQEVPVQSCSSPVPSHPRSLSLPASVRRRQCYSASPRRRKCAKWCLRRRSYRLLERFVKTLPKLCARTGMCLFLSPRSSGVSTCPNPPASHSTGRSALPSPPRRPLRWRRKFVPMFQVPQLSPLQKVTLPNPSRKVHLPNPVTRFTLNAL